MPKVSVIVPVYNSVKYIKECVDSLLNQTLKDLEIIIVDAGSTDGTLEVLQDYAKSYDMIKLIQSKKKSMGYQYNIGVKFASGEYIGFLESDDYVASDMYQTLSNILDNNEIDYVKSDYHMFADLDDRLFLGTNILPRNMRNIYGEVIFPKEYPTLIYRDVNIWNALYRADFIRANSIYFNETPKAAFQDIGFVLQTFCCADKIMYVKEDSYKYRRDNLNSSTYRPETVRFIIWEFLFIINKLEGKSQIPYTFKVCIFNRFLGLMCGFYKTLPELSSWDEDFMKEMKEFRNKMQYLLSDIPYAIRVMYGINNSLDAYMFFDDFSMFDKYRRETIVHNCHIVNDFGRKVRKHKNVIIFGAGIIGEIATTLLIMNRCGEEIFFCDNDKNKWGQKFSCSYVLSPEEAVRKYKNDDVVFLIANINYSEDIYNQLIDSGVNYDDAIPMIPCGTFEAFEMRLEDKCDG